MRILSRKQVRDKVSLSFAEISRREKRHEFPLRIQISPNRVGWLESDIDDWISELVAQRDILADSS
ncbi:MAG: AlpA family phage regulatory protein [Hyphomicrobiales bacterium]|nr:AlpA family phage regulatory protein [Hyphomicrobiales bacterium]